ncbi:hypothetical protein SAMN05216420_102262 [Nitrosospira sp. Nl5]|uniref:hypothetical protein n=1 Tax=Nitrosospira sp. Nl5 TaxID=200120 RepID=UPI000885301C|nr:hypothetical protein [Nitrosospira sp. Nl5]SCY09136.1 hypothetical protein SAMN05216420_102262 [Nitrosospira sp. Nl5]
MRATVQFIHPDRKFAILTKLLDIIQAIGNLRQHILTHGILLEKLSTSDVETLKKALTKLDYSSYTVTASSLRLLIADGELHNLFGLVIPIPGRRNDFAGIFWERGFTLENLKPNQANDLRQRLETIATVGISPDIPQPRIYTVSGQVSKADGVPLSTVGFTVRLFDALPANNFVPCGNPAALQINGAYRIDYVWQSDGRKGPDLLVRVVDPQGNIVAEGGKASAAMQEFIEITAEDFAPRTYTLTGTVRNHGTGAPLPNSYVEAVFRINTQQLIRSGTTNSKGVVLFPVDESFFSRGQGVEVLFQLYRDDQALAPLVTDTIIANLLPGDQEVEILVTLPEPDGERCVVRGAIRHVDGTPLSNVIVRAFDRDMRAETLLGQTIADTAGAYEISYHTGQFRQPEKAQADLFIRVFEPRKGSEEREGEEELEGGEIAVSDIVFNAAQEQTIDLEIESEKFRGPSEYERYLAKLEPLVESVPVHELINEDLDFLNGKTGIPLEQLDYLRLDAQWAFQHALAPAACYGLFRQGLPTDLLQLSNERSSHLEEALQASLSHNIVPAALATQADQVIEQLLFVTGSRVFELDADAG